MDESKVSFPTDEVLERAFGNINALILITMTYFKEQGQSPRDWIAFVGQRFAPGWEDRRDMGAKEVARQAALNTATGGADLRSLSGDAHRGEAVVTYKLSDEMIQAFGTSQDEADAFLDVFSPIAQQLGMTFSRERQGDEVTLIFSK